MHVVPSAHIWSDQLCTITTFGAGFYNSNICAFGRAGSYVHAAVADDVDDDAFQLFSILTCKRFTLTCVCALYSRRTSTGQTSFGKVWVKRMEWEKNHICHTRVFTCISLQLHKNAFRNGILDDNVVHNYTIRTWDNGQYINAIRFKYLHLHTFAIYTFVQLHVIVCVWAHCVGDCADCDLL